MKRIYLAGPMRGIPNFNFPAFDVAAEALRAEGFEVFSPADHDREINGGEIEDNPNGDETLATLTVGFDLRKALLADTGFICRHAEAIALLPGWENSSGARAEKALGEALGLTIISLGKDYL